MPTTSNFGWNTPADTDLVKDGAAAIRTLGNSIDTSFVDLKGGTTGQVLAKASNTDLDYTWTNVDPLTILDAKGDLISATAADTPARLAVGANGTVLTADSTTATGLRWATPAGWNPDFTLLNAGGTALTSGTTVTVSGISGVSSLFIWADNVSSSNAEATVFIRPNNNTTLANYDGYFWRFNGSNDTITRFNITSLGQARYELGKTGSSQANDINGYLWIYGTNTSGVKPVTFMGGGDGETNNNSYTGMGLYKESAAITSITIGLTTGTFDAGTIYVYGA